MSYIMVLNDGETYTMLDGCQILFINDNGDASVYEDGELDSLVKRAFTEGNVYSPIGGLLPKYSIHPVTRFV